MKTSPQDRATRIRKEIKRIEDGCRSDEVAEACEALRDAVDCLDVALEDEFGPRDADMEDGDTC